jgi:hypothetical protein
MDTRANLRLALVGGGLAWIVMGLALLLYRLA